MEGAISNKEVELTKLKEVISKLEETKTNKLEIQKKHEEILLQSNVGFLFYVDSQFPRKNNPGGPQQA